MATNIHSDAFTVGLSPIMFNDLKLYQADANTLALQNAAGGTYKNFIAGDITASGAAPNIYITESDQVDPAGRWRLRADGGVFVIQRAATASWATSTTWLNFDAVNDYINVGKGLYGVPALGIGTGAYPISASNDGVFRIFGEITNPAKTYAIGVFSVIQYASTVADITTTGYAAKLDVQVGTSNTKNWTTFYGIATELDFGDYVGAPAGAYTIDTAAGFVTTIRPADGVTLTTAIDFYGTNPNCSARAFGVLHNAYGAKIDRITAGDTINYGIYLSGGSTNAIYVAADSSRFCGIAGVMTAAVTANDQTVNAAPTAIVLTAASAKAFTGTAQQLVLPSVTPVANGAGGNISLTGFALSQGAITNPATGDTETVTVKQVVITGAAGQTKMTGVYSWTGADLTMPAQAANGAANTAFGVKITGGTAAGTGTYYQRGIDITMAAVTDTAIYVHKGISRFTALNSFLCEPISAASQTVNDTPTGNSISAVNGSSFTGYANWIVLPSIYPTANGSGISLVGLALRQGGWNNAADTETITVKQIVITGAAGVALETGVYTFEGIDITTPAQAANGAINAGYGIKITGGAVAGHANAFQRGIDITMAAAADKAINVVTGASYFGGEVALGDGVALKIEETLGTDLTFSGVKSDGVAGAALGQFDCLYMGADGKWEITDADAAATMPCLAMAAAAANEDAAVSIILPGSYVRDDSWNWTIGGLLYADTTTAGGMTQAAPSGSGDVVQVLGYAVTADIIFFNPSLTLVVIA